MADNHSYDPFGKDDFDPSEVGLPGSAGSPPPMPIGKQSDDSLMAADLIRQKVARIYADEPAAQAEMAEAQVVSTRSPHQEFMYQLSTSGKDLATIQTEWHNYYLHLPDDQKHQVWQEFYASQSAITGHTGGQAAAAVPGPVVSDHSQTLAEHKHQAARPADRPKTPKLREARSRQEIQATIRHKVTAGGKLKAKHHLQSLAAGIGTGLVVVFIFLFGFFNEVFIAPFIQPSRASASTPLIVDSNGIAPTSTPEVIIPKINVEIPVDYSETSTTESVIENDLEHGVVHYPTTVRPGELGNAAYFGHSSNNILNPGKYKFAFVLLHTLVPGDTFYLTYSGKVYVYKVISKTVVDPSNVGVLGPVPGQTATATLITCDPPGTSLHRLIVVGQQISPDPSGNSKPAGIATTSSPTNLPGNGPTLWSRYIGTAWGKVVSSLVVVGALVWLWRWINQPMRTARSG